MEKNVIKLLILFLTISFTGCNNEKNIIHDNIISKWLYEIEIQDDPFLNIDTLYNCEYVSFENEIKVKKQLFDSMIDNSLLGIKYVLDDYIFLIDTIFYKKLREQSIKCVKAYISYNSYDVAVIYNKQYGLLAKKYGHGKAMLKELQYVKNGKVIKSFEFFEFSKALLDNESLFPKPSWPPPPPPPH